MICVDQKGQTINRRVGRVRRQTRGSAAKERVGDKETQSLIIIIINGMPQLHNANVSHDADDYTMELDFKAIFHLPPSDKLRQRYYTFRLVL